MLASIVNAYIHFSSRSFFIQSDFIPIFEPPMLTKLISSVNCIKINKLALEIISNFKNILLLFKALWILENLRFPHSHPKMSSWLVPIPNFFKVFILVTVLTWSCKETRKCSLVSSRDCGRLPGCLWPLEILTGLISISLSPGLCCFCFKLHLSISRVGDDANVSDTTDCYKHPWIMRWEYLDFLYNDSVYCIIALKLLQYYADTHYTAACQAYSFKIQWMEFKDCQRQGKTIPDCPWFCIKMRMLF